MKILGTYETRKFDSLDEARALIDELEATTSYDSILKNAVAVGEVIDCPIDPHCFENAPVALIGSRQLANGVNYVKMEAHQSFTIAQKFNEQMEEAMKESHLAIGSKNELGEFEAEPLALNALPSLVSQAIGGKSSLLNQTEDKSVAKNMPTEQKAAILNAMLTLRKDRCKLYRCDGMVRYVASDNYVYLPISELLDALKEGLLKDFPHMTFEEASIGHQYSEFLFILNDPMLKKSIGDILGQAGINDEYEPAVLFNTSNTGDSGANLHPILLGPGNSVLIVEDGESLEHIGKDASIETFAKNVSNMMALFKATPERLEGLAEFGLKHPANAYKNVAFKANLPVGMYAEQASSFEIQYGGYATALDLYFELSNRLYGYAAETDMNIVRRTKLLGSLAKKFLTIENLKECDVDLVFSEQAEKENE